MAKKWKYSDFMLGNRWKQRHPNSDWTIIGLSWWYCGPGEKRFTIHFIGIDLMFWFKRKYK